MTFIKKQNSETDENYILRLKLYLSKNIFTDYKINNLLINNNNIKYYEDLIDNYDKQQSNNQNNQYNQNNQFNNQYKIS